MNTTPLEAALAGTGYTPLREIGRGGFGVVYEARHPNGLMCAVKVMRRAALADPSAAERLRLEIESLQAIHHPSVVAVFGAGRTNGGDLFYAMELLEGTTVGKLMQARGPMGIVAASDLVAQVLDCLDAAHRLGIIHRDIKPENLFVSSDGQVKVVDFGIAKVVEPHAGGPAPLAVPTADGMMVGSLRWCSPEVIASIPPDARADLYSVGLVFHALLTGKPAWDQVRDQAGLVRAQLMNMPSSVVGMLPGAEGEVADALVARLCAKKPEDRFATAGDAASALRSKVARFRPVDEAPVPRVQATPAAPVAPPAAPPLAKVGVATGERRPGAMRGGEIVYPRTRAAGMFSIGFLCIVIIARLIQTILGMLR